MHLVNEDVSDHSTARFQPRHILPCHFSSIAFASCPSLLILLCRSRHHVPLLFVSQAPHCHCRCRCHRYCTRHQHFTSFCATSSVDCRQGPCCRARLALAKARCGPSRRRTRSTSPMRAEDQAACHHQRADAEGPTPDMGRFVPHSCSDQLQQQHVHSGECVMCKRMVREP
jgi:hypothetical protein